MNVQFEVKSSPGLQQLMRGSRMISGYAVMQRAGQAVTDYLRLYHKGIDWKGPRYMSPSLGFADKVVAGWRNPIVSGQRVTITNTFGLLGFKVSGGPIMPVRAKYLTIPLVSEAKGKSVAEFRAGSTEPLFQAGMAICRRIGKRLEAVYALSKGVTQDPYPNAMPSDEELARIFTEAVNNEIARTLGDAGRMAA